MLPAGWRARLADAADTNLFIYRKILPWRIGALALGSALHGFVPAVFFERRPADAGAWNVPLYVSANATIPLLEAFIAESLPLGSCFCSPPSASRCPNWCSCAP